MQPVAIDYIVSIISYPLKEPLISTLDETDCSRWDNKCAKELLQEAKDTILDFFETFFGQRLIKSEV